MNNERFQLYLGDCLETLRTLQDNSVDSIVTDPPYGLSFMGKRWDYDVPSTEIWAECLRVLKPGGHLLAFAGTRTQHRMAVRIEDAGFEIRDMIAWVYGSGFPKSLDVSKALDKAANVPTDGASFKHMLSDAVAASGMSRKLIDDRCGFTMRYDTALEKDPSGWGCTYPGIEQWNRIKNILPIPGEWDRFVAGVERDVLSRQRRKNSPSGIVSAGRESVEIDRKITAPATDAAAQWQGWGTALKPALEPITVARKPLTGTVAANVLAHGTGAINIDGCRVAGVVPRTIQGVENGSTHNGWQDKQGLRQEAQVFEPHAAGRWPANLIHDGSDEVVALFPAEKGESAARFFYCAKTSRKDRNEGCGEVTTWESADQNLLMVKFEELQKAMCAAMTLLPEGCEWSTSLFGSGITEQFRLVIKSIIEMVLRTTTESKTSKCYPRLSINESIRGATEIALETGSSLAELAASISQLIPGTTSEKTGYLLPAVHAALLALSETSKHAKQGNVHSTVKPTDLMAYLCRLVTPPGGIVLDPFMGSGSTGKAAMREGFQFIGCELDAAYLAIAQARIKHELTARQAASDLAAATPAQSDFFGEEQA